MMSSEVTSAAAAAAAMKEVELQRQEVEEVEEEELELGLSLGANTTTTSSNSRKHHYCCRILTAKDFPPPAPESSSSSSSSSSGIKRAPQPPRSSQVVGWPPIRAFRMNSLVSLQPSKPNDNAADQKKKNRGHGHGHTCHFVKVNKDGDPIGRKVDLGAHTSYESLAVALELMFRKPTAPAPCPSPSPSPSDNSTNASKLLLGGSSEFALTYKDKDGDWMLVGDVPYGMFLDTVKRLRIMRTSDASGLAPRFQPATSVS